MLWFCAAEDIGAPRKCRKTITGLTIMSIFHAINVGLFFSHWRQSMWNWKFKDMDVVISQSLLGNIQPEVITNEGSSEGSHAPWERRNIESYLSFITNNFLQVNYDKIIYLLFASSRNNERKTYMNRIVKSDVICNYTNKYWWYVCLFHVFFFDY